MKYLGTKAHFICIAICIGCITCMKPLGTHGRIMKGDINLAVKMV